MRSHRRVASAPALLSNPARPMLRLGGIAVDLSAVDAVAVAFNGQLFAAGIRGDVAQRAHPERVATLLDRLADEIRQAF